MLTRFPIIELFTERFKKNKYELRAALPCVVILKNCVNNNVSPQYKPTRGGTRSYDKRNPLAVLFYDLCFLFVQSIRVPNLRRGYYLKEPIECFWGFF